MGVGHSTPGAEPGSVDAALDLKISIGGHLVATGVTALLVDNLGSVVIATALAVPADDVKAAGTLTIAEPVTINDTMTIGTTVYTFKAGATAVAGQIGIGADEPATKLAIVAAINGTDTFNAAHPLVSAANFATDACVITAKATGVAGNAIAITETFTHDSNIFDAAVLGTTAAGVGTGVSYAKGCLFIDTDVAAGTSGLYVNEGTSASCSFKLVTNA